MNWQLNQHLGRGDYNDLKGRPVAFGWNGLGEVVFNRTYSRDGERWNDVIERVIDGMYTIQHNWALDHGVKWNEDKVLRSALESYDLAQRMLWTPPGRGLWAMGTPLIHDRHTPEALNNCAFISTSDLATERGDVFRWVMEMLMLGVGVGFDTLGAGTVKVEAPVGSAYVIIDDTRESWAKSVELLFDSYTGGKPALRFDYSRIRPAGAPIKGFGGVAAGPAPLVTLHVEMQHILDRRIGQVITVRDIADLANVIGKCVIAGNVRRSAEIALGNPTDEFLYLKDYSRNSERAAWGWVSNNSIYAFPSHTADYWPIAEMMAENGEPGIVWMDNVRNYGRMNGVYDGRDAEAAGFNPCAEQPLHHRELCTLVEIHLPRIPDRLTFARVIKSAYLYGKTVTLLSDEISDPASRNIMVKNRRIGLSLTGQAQFAGMHGRGALNNWMEYGHQIVQYYDEVYSRWLGVSNSIRTTTVKPSGTVSLVTGVTPGVHMAPSRYCIRRMRLAEDSPLVDSLQTAGVPVEPDVVAPRSVVAEFPVDAGPGMTEETATLEQQLSYAADAQRLWADNGVSVTAKFKDWREIPTMLDEYQWKLKSVSFLPYTAGYEQAPYEPIGEAEYARRVAGMKRVEFTGHEVDDKFCDTDACEIGT